MSVLLLLIICVSASSAFPTATDQDAEARINSWVINPVRRPGMSIGGLRPGGMLLMVMEPNATMAPETPIPPQEVAMPQTDVVGPAPGTTATTAESSEVSSVGSNEAASTGTTDTPEVSQQTVEPLATDDSDTNQSQINATIAPGVHDTTEIPPGLGVSEASVDTSVVTAETTGPSAAVNNEVAQPDEVSSALGPAGDFNASSTIQPDTDTQEQSTADTSDETATTLNHVPPVSTQDHSGLNAAEPVGTSDPEQGSEVSPGEDDTTQDPSVSDTTDADSQDHQSSEVADSSEEQQDGGTNHGEDDTKEDPAGSGTTEVNEEGPKPTEVTGSNDVPQGQNNASEDNLAQDPAGSTSIVDHSPEYSTEVADLASNDPTGDSAKPIPDTADDQDRPGSGQDNPATETSVNTGVEQNTESILAGDEETPEHLTEVLQDPGQQETSQTIPENSVNPSEQGTTGSEAILQDPDNDQDSEPEQITERIPTDEILNQDLAGSDGNQDELQDTEENTELTETLTDPDSQEGTETIPHEERPSQNFSGDEVDDPEQSTELNPVIDDSVPSILSEGKDPEPGQITETSDELNNQDHSESTTAEDQSDDPVQNAGPSQTDPINLILSEDQDPVLEENTEHNPDKELTNQAHLQDQIEHTTEPGHTAEVLENNPEVVQPQVIQINPNQDQATKPILGSVPSSTESENEQATYFPDHLIVDPTFDPLQPHLYEDQTAPNLVESLTDASFINADSNPQIFSGPAVDNFQQNQEDVTFHIVTIPATESDPETTEPADPVQPADSGPILSEEVIEVESSQRKKRSLNSTDESPSRQFGHRPYPIPSRPQIVQDPGYGTSSVRRMYDYCYGLLCELKRNLLHFRLF